MAGSTMAVTGRVTRWLSVGIHCRGFTSSTWSAFGNGSQSRWSSKRIRYALGALVLGGIGGSVIGYDTFIKQHDLASADVTAKPPPQVEAVPPEDQAPFKGSVLYSTNRHNAKPLIFSGSANSPLAREICAHLGTKLGEMTVRTFADGEIGIQVHENVRGRDVYIVQPTCPPGVNDNLMELVLMISTFRRASARKITAIIPYYGYARQDRKMTSRVPISAADVAILLESMGVDRVVAVDLHCGQIQGFFGPRTPCDNLEGAIVALPYFASLGLVGESTVVVSPDAGGVYRAKKFRDGLKNEGLDASLAMIIKQRERANSVAQMDLVGDVEGCDVVIVDDMIDTAGTLCKAASELKKRGANRIFAFATHGLFNGPAVDRIKQSDFEKVVVCNTIPLPDHKKTDKIMVLSIAKVLAQAIARIHSKKSVSELFVKSDDEESPALSEVKAS